MRAMPDEKRQDSEPSDFFLRCQISVRKIFFEVPAAILLAHGGEPLRAEGFGVVSTSNYATNYCKQEHV